MELIKIEFWWILQIQKGVRLVERLLRIILSRNRRRTGKSYYVGFIVKLFEEKECVEGVREDIDGCSYFKHLIYLRLGYWGY